MTAPHSEVAKDLEGSAGAPKRRTVAQACIWESCRIGRCRYLAGMATARWTNRARPTFYTASVNGLSLVVTGMAGVWRWSLARDGLTLMQGRAADLAQAKSIAEAMVRRGLVEPSRRVSANSQQTA